MILPTEFSSPRFELAPCSAAQRIHLTERNGKVVIEVRAGTVVDSSLLRILSDLVAPDDWRPAWWRRWWIR
jgi:hypothetical protein